VTKTLKYRTAGFTLVELMIVIALIGIFATIAAPIMKTYIAKARYSNVRTTLHQLMNGLDAYFIQNGSFYPDGRGRLTINAGEEVDLPELGYNFSDENTNRYRIRSTNRSRRGNTINIYTITVDTDFDYNGNGINDRFIATTDFRNESPVIRRGVEYYRYIRQVW
jgi:prepilin-type N-terminal cleavage/methylation domain-containing protein